MWVFCRKSIWVASMVNKNFIRHSLLSVSPQQQQENLKNVSKFCFSRILSRVWSEDINKILLWRKIFNCMKQKSKKREELQLSKVFETYFLCILAFPHTRWWLSERFSLFGSIQNDDLLAGSNGILLWVQHKQHQWSMGFWWKIGKSFQSTGTGRWPVSIFEDFARSE